MTSAGISQITPDASLPLPLSSKTLERLAKMPGPGGTHRWLAQIAGGIKRVLKPEACERFLARCCGEFVTHRQVTEREIKAAVAFAYGTDGEGRRGPEWPEARPALITKALADSAAPLFDGVTDTGMTAAEALALLFRPGELVCGGLACELPTVQEAGRWMAGAESAQFVVPNPMRGASGLTKEGKTSARCQANVASRRWIVAEFDDPEMSKAEQAKIASVLARGLPLRLAVDSGGKSLHCWFACEEAGERGAARFFWLACALGADPSRWDPCGWVRMPGGVRVKADGSKVRQRVVYCDKKGGY